MIKYSLKFIALSALLSVPLFLMNCGTSTHITGTYLNPDLSGSTYDAIMVTALTPNVVARRAVEHSIAEELRSKGVNAMASMTVFPPNFLNDKPTKEDILKVVREKEMKGVLTITLLDEQEETRYVPGTTPYAPYPAYGFYGSFGGYYGNYYSMMYDPGYYTTSRTYFVENNLYDVESEALVWSAQSQTYDPSNIDAGSRALARALVYEMNKDGVLPKK